MLTRVGIVENIECWKQKKIQLGNRIGSIWLLIDCEDKEEGE